MEQRGAEGDQLVPCREVPAHLLEAERPELTETDGVCYLVHVFWLVLLYARAAHGDVEPVLFDPDAQRLIERRRGAHFDF
jgi:hypothetical protein